MLGGIPARRERKAEGLGPEAGGGQRINPTEGHCMKAESAELKGERSLTRHECAGLLALGMMSGDEIRALAYDRPVMRVTLAWMEGAGETAARCTATIQVRTPAQAVRTVRREFRVSPETRVIVKRIVPLNAGGAQ